MMKRVEVSVVAFLEPEMLESKIGDHLVEIHVGGGSGSTLQWVERKLVTVLSGNEFRTGELNGLELPRFQEPKAGVGAGTAPFHVGQGLHEDRWPGSPRPYRRRPRHRTLRAPQPTSE